MRATSEWLPGSSNQLWNDRGHDDPPTAFCITRLRPVADPAGRRRHLRPARLAEVQSARRARNDPDADPGRAPYPPTSAWLLIALEIGGGALLILGLLVRGVGVLFALDMAGAFVLVHRTHGFFITGGGNGVELVLLLGVVGLMLACTGGGRYGIDGSFVRRRRDKLAERQVLDEREFEPAL